MILKEGPALENAKSWYANTWETIWTDGSRLEDGKVGAECAWRTQEGIWEGRRFHLGDNKEVFDAEVFAIYQALRVFESRNRSGRRFAVFSDCQPAIQRVGSDALGLGQCWARAIVEVASRLVASGNEVAIYWVPAHAGVTGNEKADEMAKEAARSRRFDVQDEVRWQASLPHLSRRATESRARATSQRIRDHVRPERGYRPPGGTGLRRKALRKVRKSTAQRYYQLLSDHAAIGSFLHGRMTGPQRLETDKCWWCNCGKR